MTPDDLRDSHDAKLWHQRQLADESREARQEAAMFFGFLLFLFLCVLCMGVIWH
ncbi:MAG: hypothetical protein KGL39_35460 [Patescibacteria group bacterium]|nr:hypothetical protein [Patescibacteria group bacterium]